MDTNVEQDTIRELSQRKQVKNISVNIETADKSYKCILETQLFCSKIRVAGELYLYILRTQEKQVKLLSVNQDC